MPDSAEDDEADDPIEAIYEIIDRYYEGLTREDEGMGSE